MIPDYQTIMLPLLQYTSDNQVHRFREVVEAMSEKFKLSDQERRELLPSGSQAIFDNRVGWARFYLMKAGLIKSEKRGTLQITQQGLNYLASNPKDLNAKGLEQFPQFAAFLAGMQKKRQTENKEEGIESIQETNQTPEEAIEYAYLKLKNDLAQELIETLMNNPPSFFEKSVIDLLIKMGYGGSRKEAGSVIGKSGDSGIDGIIKEDRLGLDTIYIQAKRWENTVPVREIRDFAGALLSMKARKGIFITTSNFSKSAYDFVESIEHKIILIDGEQMAKLMFEHNVGVSLYENYEVKRIDLDYFEE